jgi:hypothetical protein
MIVVRRVQLWGRSWSGSLRRFDGGGVRRACFCNDRWFMNGILETYILIHPFTFYNTLLHPIAVFS